MNVVDCDCDAGCVEYNVDGRIVYGICPKCEGRGWYIDNTRAARVQAWLRQWAEDELWKEAN